MFANCPGLQIERPVLCYLSAHHHLGVPVDICHVIFVSLVSLKSHSNKASTTFFQLLAISILVNTRWRPAKESIQWLIRFLMSPQMWVLYIDWVYLVWICKIFGSNLNIQKIPMLKFKVFSF